MASTKPTKINRKPRILVLEGLSGAARCIRLAGGEAITVSPRDMDAIDEALAAKFDGLLLTGGGDVDPRLYGEKPHKKVYGVNEVRDYTEWTALDRAAELDVPVMGICRGHQLMTVHNGGALRQHIGGHRGIDHLVFGESGSRFRRVIKAEHGYFVSLHHQVVKRTGDGWRVAARAKDGCIEAVESKDGRCLGVQFHPEMDHGVNEHSRLLFRWLVGEAAKRANLVRPKPLRMGERVSYWDTPPRRPAKRKGAPLPERQPRRQPQMQLPASARRDSERRNAQGNGPVKVSWVCPTCGIRFDEKQDQEDHIYWFHGNPVISTTEPPPGHADWMEVSS
jgi:putative glutamine amidotransferase